LKIDYEYEEKNSDHENGLQAEGEALSAEKLRLLPLKLRNKFRDAILEGDKKGLDRLIREVGETADVGIAQVLQGLANNYEYDALMRLIDAAGRR
jgi:hypothetical protein